MRSLSQFFGFTGVRNKAGLNEYGRHIRRFEDQKRRLLYLFFVQLCDFAHVAKHGLPTWMLWLRLPFIDKSSSTCARLDLCRPNSHCQRHPAYPIDFLAQPTIWLFHW